MQLPPSEKETRQLILIRDRLSLYKADKLELPDLIADLDALIDSLEEQPDWRRDFRETWGVLEEVYAVSLDRNEAKLSRQHAQLVNDAINQMLQMVGLRE